MKVQSSLIRLPKLAFITLLLLGNSANASWQCQTRENGLWECNALDTKPSHQYDTLTESAVAEAPLETLPVTHESWLPISFNEYNIEPQRGCYDAYQGPLLGSLDPTAFEAAPIEIAADSSEFAAGSTSILAGNVDIKKGERRVESNVVYFHEPTNSINTNKGYRYTEPGLVITGDTAEVLLDSKQVNSQNIEYRIEEMHARGQATHVHRDGQLETIELTGASYTTCAPGANDWEVRAGQLLIDNQAGRGVAEDATLRIAGIPIAYLPYYSFPIREERKTGFLTPSFGRSEDSGTEVTLPFYWNMAPNYDATFTGRYLSKRGAQLYGEFRYLTAQHAGEWNAEYLPDDKSFGKSRHLFHITHNSEFNEHWHADGTFSHISDNEYLDELDDRFGLDNLNHLRREGNLLYNGEYVSFLTRVQGFQTIDDAILKLNRPYDRLPQVALMIDKPNAIHGVDLGLNAEVVNFDRSDSSIGGVRMVTDAGVRYDIEPFVSLPLEAAYGYIRPTFKYKFTQYQLSKEADGIDRHIDRSLPIFSVDSQLFLERETSIFSESIVQTLEPRIYYLYVPERSQDIIPVFDSAENTLTFANFFRTNRFSGADRYGDANQVTLALTSRIIQMPSGKQRLRMRAGQVFYFRDREVGIPERDSNGVLLPDMDETDKSSPLLGEYLLNIDGHWYSKGYVEWDYEDDNFERAQFLLRYAPTPYQVINLGYLYRNNIRRSEDQDQLHASLAWPIFDRVQFLGSVVYDLNDTRLLESVLGLEYDSCCWAIRLVSHTELERDERKSNNSTKTDMAFYVQFVFKGLTSVGRKADSLLKEHIPGYDPDLSKSNRRRFYE